MACNSLSPLSHNPPLFHGKYLYIFLSRQTLKGKVNPNTNLALLCFGKPTSYLLDFSDQSQIPFYSAGFTERKTYQLLKQPGEAPCPTVKLRASPPTFFWVRGCVCVCVCVFEHVEVVIQGSSFQRNLLCNILFLLSSLSALTVCSREL